MWDVCGCVVGMWGVWGSMRMCEMCMVCDVWHVCTVIECVGEVRGVMFVAWVWRGVSRVPVFCLCVLSAACDMRSVCWAWHVLCVVCEVCGVCGTCEV